MVWCGGAPLPRGDCFVTSALDVAFTQPDPALAAFDRQTQFGGRVLAMLDIDRCAACMPLLHATTCGCLERLCAACCWARLPSYRPELGALTVTTVRSAWQPQSSPSAGRKHSAGGSEKVRGPAVQDPERSQISLSSPSYHARSAWSSPQHKC
eukprot:366165-Chlamydomonas_euryale.AAC.4